MKLQSLRALSLCITISSSITAGGMLSLIYDTSTTVTLPTAEILNSRINQQQQRLNITPEALAAMQFVNTFAGKTLTTHQISKEMNRLYAIRWNTIQPQILPEQKKACRAAWDEQKKDIFPQLYRLLLEDQKSALKELTSVGDHRSYAV